MDKLLMRMKAEAKRLSARLQPPRFYIECEKEVAHSRASFFDHPLLVRLQEDCIPFLYDDYGHGIDHSKKVSIEAGAIVLAEMRRGDIHRARHLSLLAQMSGLLHDICRLEEDHAQKGAELSESILADYPLDDLDKQNIAFAISDHEAFTSRKQTDDPEAELLSGALYDADKFRWGPDNFSTTLWEICDYNDITVDELLASFPAGVKKIEEIASTFRTTIGQSLGPEFIDLGLVLSKDVFEKLKEVAKSDLSDNQD